MNRPLSLLALISSSLFLGACLVIGVVLVPYWQSMQGLAFLDYFSRWGPILGMLMFPLGGFAQLTLILACWEARADRSAFRWWLMSALCFSLIIVLFVFYFSHTNLAMIHKVIDISILSQTLVTWQVFHWLRTVIALSSVCLAMVGILKQSRKLRSRIV
jgi:hypothetical protein